ncbi:MAG: GUN4 domain-containing protein [Hormoscilla sp.]
MSRLSAIILGATIALVQPPIALALSPQEVAKLAEEITVKIEDCGRGSGVIFDKKGNTYYVLTAKHVDSNASKCLVITPDKIEHKIELANFKPIEGLDLAVIEFDSNNSYKVGQRGDSRLATIGTTVYIAGYARSEVTDNKRTWRVSDGKIIGRPDEATKGYSLIYNSLTRDGMSGGPVLNADGKIIGIHGAADKKYGDKENYGIPIEKFIEVRGSSFWPIPSPPERDEGLSWPLILLGGLAILGGGASLGYLFGSRTQSKNKTKVSSYSPSPKVNSTSEITPLRSKPSRPVKGPTILSVDHSEVTAQPEELVPARYHKLRDLLAAREWEEADIETARVMLEVAGREEGRFRVKDLENFPCEDLRAIDKLWVKYSNGRFGFSVQKRIWLEEGGKVDYETECRLGDRVGWRRKGCSHSFRDGKGEWHLHRDLTFSLDAPTGHLPGWVLLGEGWMDDGVRIMIGDGVFFSRAQMCKL